MIYLVKRLRKKLEDKGILNLPELVDVEDHIEKLQAQLAAVREQILLMPQSGSGYDYWVRELTKAAIGEES